MTVRNRKISLVLITLLGIGFNGCAYKAGTAKIDKDFYKDSKALASDNKKYEEIGDVTLVENGWLLSSCDTMGKESVEKLKLKAQSMGADAVMNIRWQGDQGILTKYPQCKTAWGFVLLWPAWFFPGTSDTTVTGTMIKYTDQQARN